MEEKHFKTSLPTINLVYASAGERRKGESEKKRRNRSRSLVCWQRWKMDVPKVFDGRGRGRRPASK